MVVPWLGTPVPSLGQGYQIIVGSTNQPVPSAKWRSRFLWPRDATICLLGQIQPLALLPFPKLCQALLLPFCQIHVLIANLLIFLSWSSLPLAFSKALAAFQKKIQLAFSKAQVAFSKTSKVSIIKISSSCKQLQKHVSLEKETHCAT